MMRSVRIYWYRPRAHFPESRLAREVLRSGDHLTVQSLSTHRGTPLRGSPDHYEARRDLPEAIPISSRFPWLASRMQVYTKRAVLRYRAVSEGGYDLCHIFLLNYFTDAWSLRRLTRYQPLVATVHDVFPHESRIPPRLERFLLSSMYRSAGTMVVAHDQLKRRLVGEFGIAPERIEVIPLPVEEAVDPEAGEPSGPATVLFFGHFRPNKGVDVLLEAIRRIPPCDVRFVFAGRGLPAIEEKVREAAKRDSRIVAQIGYVPREEIGGYFSESHLVVLPYTSFASQSGVLGDAYSHLVPIVGTDVGAIGETLRSDGSGWVVPPGDVDGLVSALMDALEDEGARLRVRLAMARVRESRTFEAVGRAHRDLYARLVGQGV